LFIFVNSFLDDKHSLGQDRHFAAVVGAHSDFIFTGLQVRGNLEAEQPLRAGEYGIDPRWKGQRGDGLGAAWYDPACFFVDVSLIDPAQGEVQACTDVVVAVVGEQDIAEDEIAFLPDVGNLHRSGLVNLIADKDQDGGPRFSGSGLCCGGQDQVRVVAAHNVPGRTHHQAYAPAAAGLHREAGGVQRNPLRRLAPLLFRKGLSDQREGEGDNAAVYRDRFGTAVRDFQDSGAHGTRPDLDVDFFWFDGEAGQRLRACGLSLELRLGGRKLDFTDGRAAAAVFNDGFGFVITGDETRG